MRRCAIALVAFCLAIGAGGAGHAAVDDTAVAVRDLSRRLDLQTELPIERPDVEEPRTRGEQGWRINATVAEIVLYSALAIGLGIILYTLRDRLPQLGKPRLAARRPDAVAEAASVERMVETQGEADDLAAQGRYAEAMHALLLRGLAEMRRRLRIEFADSLTSREILRALDLPADGKPALGDLIRRVEIVHFGLHPAGRDDYIHCRAAYEALTAAMRQGSAA